MGVSKKDRAIRKCELPDIVEFIKISRMFVRQIEFLNKQEIPKEYLSITKESVIKVNDAAEKWIKK